MTGDPHAGADAPLPPVARPVIDVAQLVSTSLPDLGSLAPAPDGMTLDGLMRGMLQPMLKHWLDANLPEIVEKVAQAEIRRLTGHD